MNIGQTQAFLESEDTGNLFGKLYGKVLAASINLDCICAASRNGDNVIRISDITYREAFCVDLSNL